MHYVALSCRCLIGTVFLVSVLTKVAPGSFRAFAESLRAMEVLPAPLVRASAIGVVCAELAVVVLLVWTPTVRVGALLAALLLIAFAAAITVSLARNTNASCRCFGAGGGRLGLRHVVRNVLLLGACLVMAAVSGSAVHADQAVAVAAAGAGVAAALLVLGMDPVAELFGRSRPAM